MAAILAQGGYWEGDVYVGVLGKVISTAPDLVDYIVASMCSFNYEYAYIITLIVNELIEDNSVKESIVH